MEPTIRQGAVIWIDEAAYTASSPERGDIVAYSYPGDAYLRVARVIGLGGDTVRVTADATYLDGAKIREPYVASGPGTTGTWKVPADTIFVVGDNRTNSADSRTNAYPVPTTAVVGEVHPGTLG